MLYQVKKILINQEYGVPLSVDIRQPIRSQSFTAFSNILATLLGTRYLLNPFEGGKVIYVDEIGGKRISPNSHHITLQILISK